MSCAVLALVVRHSDGPAIMTRDEVEPNPLKPRLPRRRGRVTRNRGQVRPDVLD